MSSTRHYLVGLTGGIGCGKTTVATLFEALGVTIVDADALAHAISAPGGIAIDALRERFGAEFINSEGALDRQRMRKLVFEDDDARHSLEAILHPLIRDATDAAILAARSPYVMLVIPLLFESKNWRSRVDRACAVDCTPEEQIARVTKRSGLSEAEVEAIMARQVSRATRLALADDVIDNSGTQNSLNTVVATLHEKYLRRARDAQRL